MIGYTIENNREKKYNGNKHLRPHNFQTRVSKKKENIIFYFIIKTNLDYCPILTDI